MSARKVQGLPSPAIFNIGEKLQLSKIDTDIFLKMLSYMEENDIDGYIVIYADYIYRDMFNRKFSMQWERIATNLEMRLTSKLGWFFVTDDKNRTAKIRVVLGPLRDYNEIVIFENPDNGSQGSSIYYDYRVTSDISIQSKEK